MTTERRHVEQEGPNAIRASVYIAGIGACLPDRIVSNEDLVKNLDTNVEWIEQRTGIKKRHIADDDQCTSDFAVVASERAMARAGVTAEDIDLIMTATITPDNIFPTLACWLQKRLGCREIGAIDLSAACSGFVYGLGFARNMIALDGYRNILLVGAETLSKITDPRDRETCVIFADGAGAAVLQPSTNGISWMGPAFLASQGRPDLLSVPGGGSRQPATVESVQQGDHYMKMAGRQVFKFVVGRCADMIRLEFDRHRISVDDIKYIIPHQANQRIMDAIADRLGLPRGKVYSNIASVGNTSAASVPIAMAEMDRKGLIRRGDLLLLCVFGGGITWASMVLKW